MTSPWELFLFWVACAGGLFLVGLALLLLFVLWMWLLGGRERPGL